MCVLGSQLQLLTHHVRYFITIFFSKASVNVTLFGFKLYPLVFAYHILQSCASTWLLENATGCKSD